MVNYESPGLDATFSALGDPTRRAILARLSRGESSIVELAAPFDVSLPAILKHVRVLEDAGLLEREKEGRVNRCQLQATPMRNAAAWIEEYRRFWERRFDALADFLKETQKEDGQWQRRNRTRNTHCSSEGHSRLRGKKSSKRSPRRKC